MIVEGVKADGLDRLKALCAEKRVPLIVALAQVFFEHDLTAIRELVRRCVEANVTVEVNSWGVWHLAKAAGAHMEAGPGFPVLNTLAARMLANCVWNRSPSRSRATAGSWRKSRPSVRFLVRLSFSAVPR